MGMLLLQADILFHLIQKMGSVRREQEDLYFNVQLSVRGRNEKLEPSRVSMSTVICLLLCRVELVGC